MEQKQNLEKQICECALNDTDIKKINNKIKNSNVVDYKKHFSDTVMKREYFIKTVYIMRFKLKIPATHMASYFDMNIKTLYYKLKQLNWEYTMKQAQQIAADTSRDYSVIRIHSKQTELQRVQGSDVENYTRQKLNLDLTENLKNAQVIVGCNNLSILQDISLECDIPIIINNQNIWHKFEIEFNGDYWHKDKTKINNDNIKIQRLQSMGYRTYTVWQFSNSVKQNTYGSIDQQIENIENEIYNIVE